MVSITPDYGATISYVKMLLSNDALGTQVIPARMLLPPNGHFDLVLADGIARPGIVGR